MSFWGDKHREKQSIALLDTGDRSCKKSRYITQQISKLSGLASLIGHVDKQNKLPMLVPLLVQSSSSRLTILSITIEHMYRQS